MVVIGYWRGRQERRRDFFASFRQPCAAVKRGMWIMLN